MRGLPLTRAQALPAGSSPGIERASFPAAWSLPGGAARLRAEEKVLGSGYAPLDKMHGVTPDMGGWAEGLGDLGDFERGYWNSLNRDT